MDARRVVTPRRRMQACSMHASKRARTAVRDWCAHAAPQTLDDVVGNAESKGRLRRALQSGRPAVLVTGGAGVGKRTVCTLAAKAAGLVPICVDVTSLASAEALTTVIDRGRSACLQTAKGKCLIMLHADCAGTMSSTLTAAARSTKRCTMVLVAGDPRSARCRSLRSACSVSVDFPKVDTSSCTRAVMRAAAVCGYDLSPAHARKIAATCAGDVRAAVSAAEDFCALPRKRQQVCARQADASLGSDVLALGRRMCAAHDCASGASVVEHEPFMMEAVAHESCVRGARSLHECRVRLQSLRAADLLAGSHNEAHAMLVADAAQGARCTTFPSLPGHLSSQASKRSRMAAHVHEMGFRDWEHARSVRSIFSMCTARERENMQQAMPHVHSDAWKLVSDASFGLGLSAGSLKVRKPPAGRCQKRRRAAPTPARRR